MDDVWKLLIFAGLAAACGIAAKRSAVRLGLPAAAVPVVGALSYGAWARFAR